MLRHYGYASLGQLAQAILALVGLAAATRLLGTESYGTYIVIGTFLTLLTIAVSAGPIAAVLILTARDPEGRAELHGQAAIATVVLFVVVVSAAPVLSPRIASLVSSALAPSLVTLALIRLPALVYVGLVSSELAGAGRIGLVAVLSTASAALALLGVFGALIGPDPLTGAIVGTSIATLMTGGMMAIAARGVVGIRMPKRSEPWKAILRIAVPMHLGTMAYWVMLRADAIAVNSILGAGSAGIYGLALQLSERIGLLTAPLYNATAWRISAPGRTDALRTTLRVARVEFAVGVVAALAAIVLGRLVATLIAGSDYAEASIPLAVLVLGAATLPIWSVIGLFLVSHFNGAWPTTLAQIGVAAVALLGYWAITPLTGVVGPALVSTGAYLTLVGIGFVLINRHEPVRFSDLIIGRKDLHDLITAFRTARRG